MVIAVEIQAADITEEDINITTLFNNNYDRELHKWFPIFLFNTLHSDHFGKIDIFVIE